MSCLGKDWESLGLGKDCTRIPISAYMVVTSMFIDFRCLPTDNYQVWFSSVTPVQLARAHHTVTTAWVPLRCRGLQ